MAPEFATVFSAIIAITSVSINLYGGLITEKRRAELAREVERERQQMAAADEERSVVARYRGPLLEATVDLEARLYHIATLTGEWRSGEVVCEEEVVYTLFTLAQWLGFLEVIRREGPRERSFLQRRTAAAAEGGTGGVAGSVVAWLRGLGGAGGDGDGDGSSGGGGSGGPDTLTTLVEGFRFVLSAHPATLRKWYEQGDEREHPGCRSRASFLRGTPALPYSRDDAAAAAYEAGASRPPPPLPVWASSSAAAAGGGAASSAAGAGVPMIGSRGDVLLPYGTPDHQHLSYAAPPPPTKPVMLSAMQAAGPGPGGPGAAAAVGAELVIGSLDESDLAAAGLGLPDPLAAVAAAAVAGGPRDGAQLQSSPPPPPSPASAGADAAATAAAAAAALDYANRLTAAAARLGGAFPGAAGGADASASLASLSSLSSMDEAGWGLGGGGGRLSVPRDVFHVSRGAQRSIGSMMVVTPMGASRHYTLSYGDFYNRCVYGTRARAGQ
ncbi:hypothetical protein GPECTOR_121g431 [Gonium pectorale]|uniref:Uncharacterized protein n=1 Tax=Gonium pectorale TaxID=33097 RepID=A0A150FYP5_GONPE|nr:hypothetical protein GPECTOR_121g431 [Gonium pectorale]|eukprot:KXZ42731.1 hypothetical protein GPECTOR_121g431 [Gonium pectorale]